MAFLLDTNAVIAILNDPSGPVASRLRRHDIDAVAISAIVQHELYFGAFRSRRVASNVERVAALQFRVLDFGPEDAREAGRIRAQLAAHGQTIGAYDVLIAGQALARGRVLVTANYGEFVRVPDLAVEDWSTP